MTGWRLRDVYLDGDVFGFRLGVRPWEGFFFFPGDVDGFHGDVFSFFTYDTISLLFVVDVYLWTISRVLF